MDVSQGCQCLILICYAALLIPRVLHIMGCIVAVYYGMPSVVCQPCYQCMYHLYLDHCIVPRLDYVLCYH